MQQRHIIKIIIHDALQIAVLEWEADVLVDLTSARCELSSVLNHLSKWPSCSPSLVQRPSSTPRQRATGPSATELAARNS